MTDTEAHSAQAILAEILASHMPEAVSGQDNTHNHQIAAEVFTALSVGGYVCVKLPPPVAADGETACVAFSGANTVYYATPGQIDSDTLQKWEQPDDARVDATALLAAAHTADTMESKQ